jgi:GxxExxY protein
MEINSITGAIIDECIKIHNDLGPGLLESVYEELLSFRLNKRGFHVNRQVAIPLFYEDVKMEIGFRADLIVNNAVIIEIKSVETLAPVYHKQLLTYLKLTNLTVGLLINFNEALLKNGLKRIVNNYLPASSAAQRETKIDEYGKGFN